MSSVGVFEYIDKFIDLHLDTISSGVSDIFSTQLTLLFSASISLYIMFYGYMILAGKIQAPVEDLIWNLARMALLMTFITNTDGWLDLVKAAIKTLPQLGGSDDGLKFIDRQFTHISETAEKFAKKADWGAGWFVSGLVWLGFLLALVPAALIIVINKIMLFFLLSLLPLFIFCLMWGWLKESFNQYMSAILTNVLIIIVITAFLKGLVDFVIDYEVKTGINPVMAGMIYVVLGFFSAKFIGFIVLSLMNMMRVTVDKLPSAAPKGQGNPTQGNPTQGGANENGLTEDQNRAKKNRSRAKKGISAVYNHLTRF